MAEIDAEDAEETGTDIVPYVPPRDPADISYPPTLPVELVLRDKTPQELCGEYGISRDEWNTLRLNPIFIADVQARTIELKNDGVSFRLKAKLQSEGLLTRAWSMIHDPKVPANVQADLLKFTVRAAGLDGSKDQALAQASATSALQIVINMGDK